MILLSKVMPWLEDSIKRQEQEAQSEDASLWLLRTKLQPCDSSGNSAQNW